MKLPIAVLLSFVMFAALGESQVRSRNAEVAVSNGTARLTFADYSGIPRDLNYLSGAATVERADILFESTLNEISYVVVRLSGPTLKNGGMRYCGAGQEENLVWIKASHAAILDVRSIVYSSCAFSIEPIQLQITKEGLRADYVSYSEGRKFRVTYDDSRPAAGLVVTSVPEGPRSRAEELIAALIRGDWTTAARFVYLDANTRARMGIASGAGMPEAQPRVEGWFKNLYEIVRPGRVVSVKIDPAKPTHALVSYTHEDLDGFSMLYVNGDWYYVLD